MLSHWELFHWFLCLCVSVLTPLPGCRFTYQTLRAVVFVSFKSSLGCRDARGGLPPRCPAPAPAVLLHSSPGIFRRGALEPRVSAARSAGPPRAHLPQLGALVAVFPRRNRASQLPQGANGRVVSCPGLALYLFCPLFTPQTAPILCRNFNSSGWCVFKGFLKTTIYIYFFFGSIFCNLQARCESHLVTVHRSVYVEGRGRSRAVHEGSCKG